MATDENKGKVKKKLLGNYLLISKGAINRAVEQQISSYAKGEPIKPIGEILVEQEIITQEELDNSIRNQRIARLAGCPMFASLNTTELAALSKLFTEKSVPPGETFIMQGEDDPSMYVIGSGEVEVYHIDNEGNEVSIATVGEGEPIGEMGYFAGGTRTACVRAISPSQLLRAAYNDLTDYFENVPRVALAFTQVVEHRRREMEELMKKKNEG